MKYLLTIILFMSVNVFADFNITTLDCELEETKHSKSFGSKLSLRIDEKRKMMRLNLLPENSYFLHMGDHYSMVFSKELIKNQIVEHSLGVRIDSLFLSYSKKFGTEKLKSALYSCKII